MYELGFGTIQFIPQLGKVPFLNKEGTKIKFLQLLFLIFVEFGQFGRGVRQAV